MSNWIKVSSGCYIDLDKIESMEISHDGKIVNYYSRVDGPDCYCQVFNSAKEAKEHVDSIVLNREEVKGG